LEEATSAFYFVHEIKGLIQKMKSSENVFSSKREEYIESLTSLKKLAPESKQK
jgi:hypothetical protein